MNFNAKLRARKRALRLESKVASEEEMSEVNEHHKEKDSKLLSC